MRVFVRRVLRATLARTANQRASDRMPLCRAWIGLLNSTHDQRADGGARTFRAMAQPVMQWLWKIDGGTDCHAMIMAQVIEVRLMRVRGNLADDIHPYIKQDNNSYRHVFRDSLYFDGPTNTGRSQLFFFRSNWSLIDERSLPCLQICPVRHWRLNRSLRSCRVRLNSGPLFLLPHQSEMQSCGSAHSYHWKKNSVIRLSMCSCHVLWE